MKYKQTYCEIFLVRNLCLTFLYQLLTTLFNKINQHCNRSNILWKSSCSGNTQKSNRRQFSWQIWRLPNSDFNETDIHQGKFLENLKENIQLLKLSILKKETVTDVFITSKNEWNIFVLKNYLIAQIPTVNMFSQYLLLSNLLFVNLLVLPWIIRTNCKAR